MDSAAAGTSASPGRGLLTWIALYKIAKAALMLTAGVGALHLLHRNLTELVDHLLFRLNLAPDSHFTLWLYAQVLRIDDKKLKLIGAGFFTYAVLYGVEGVGLYFKKHWAEWLTLITTCLLMPLEIYELFRRPTALKVLILLLNAGVAVYLGWRIKKERGMHSGHASVPLSASRQEGEAAP